jgi:hypothetical protein
VFTDPNADKWWHSPQMVGGLWTVIVGLLAFIRRLFRRIGRNTIAIAELRTDIAELKQWKRDSGNGIPGKK